MNSYINQTPNMPMYNGYNNYRLPTYEVIKVNGRGGAVFVASKVKELINDVGAELEEAISFWMSKKASDFSIEVILQEQ